MPSAQVTICQLLIGLPVGGAEVLAARLGHRLSWSYRVVFTCLESSGELGDRLAGEGFTVHVLGKRPGIDGSTARRLHRLLQRERVDLVHAHQYGPFFYAALARLPFRRPPIVLTEHGRAFPDPRRFGHAVANRLLIRGRDRIFGVGRDVARSLIDVEGFPTRRVGVILNGVDLSAYTDCRRDREAVRAELGLRADDFVIIQVARLDPIKDHPTALRMLKRLLTCRNDVRLVIVGDGPEAGPIREMVREQGLESYVRLLGRRHDVPRLVGAADLAILTSLSEGVPLSLIEAMAAGLPVVATDVGGVSEVVVEGSTGRLAPAGDDAALAGLVLELAANPSQRELLGLAGRGRAHEVFSEDRMVDEYDRVYREVAGRPAGAELVGA